MALAPLREWARLPMVSKSLTRRAATISAKHLSPLSTKVSTSSRWNSASPPVSSRSASRSTSLGVSPRDVMAALEPYCGGFLCTDVDREGTMRGVNLGWFQDLRAATKLPIVAAGGICSRGEIRALEKIGMDAAVGMALYKNRVR